MRPVVVLNVVGLTPSMIGRHTPHLSQLAADGGICPLSGMLPAVTCSVQSTYLTGLPPSRHGIVGNGWYFREQSEIRFWSRSGRLVSGDRLWDAMKRHDPSSTCANLFWWHNAYCGADVTVNVRPIYKADGRKIPDIYTEPAELRYTLNRELGAFPLFNFWGPSADIVSSKWISEAAGMVMEIQDPTLTLVYLPHLDYPLQRLGPDHPDLPHELSRIDAICGRLIATARKREAVVIILSEYGIEKVSEPVFLNRLLRKAGLLRVREELGGEHLDPGASRAFAIADHQLAHIYVNDSKDLAETRDVIRAVPGVARVLGKDEKIAAGLDHSRSGDLVAFSNRQSWFCYYYWLDEKHAPDFARTVDIHRKPGYDPVELFFDRRLLYPELSLGKRLLKKRLGFRTLMDVVSIDPKLVKGSHGLLPGRTADGPLVISSEPGLLPDGKLESTAVKGLILKSLNLNV